MVQPNQNPTQTDLVQGLNLFSHWRFLWPRGCGSKLNPGFHLPSLTGSPNRQLGPHRLAPGSSAHGLPKARASDSRSLEASGGKRLGVIWIWRVGFLLDFPTFNPATKVTNMATRRPVLIKRTVMFFFCTHPQAESKGPSQPLHSCEMPMTLAQPWACGGRGVCAPKPGMVSLYLCFVGDLNRRVVLKLATNTVMPASSSSP